MQKIFPLRVSRKQVRMIAWPLLIVLFVVVGVPLLFFFYWFDAAKVKQIVINQFNNQSYSVVINGSVEPRTWHGLSVFISDLTVEDKAKHKILHINTANGQLSWLDLIIGKYKIKRIALNGLTFYQGNSKNVNYAGLLNYNNIANSEFNKLTYLSISNLNLIESSDRYFIRDASLYLSEMTSSPLIKLNFKLAKYHANVNIQGQVNQIENNNIIVKNMNSIITTPSASIELQSSAHYAYLTQEFWVEDTRGALKSANYSGSINLDTLLLSGYGLTVDNLLLSLNNSQGKYNQTYNVAATKIATANFSNYTAANVMAKYVAANATSKLNLNIEINSAMLDKSFNLANHGCKLDFSYSLVDMLSSDINGSLKGACNYFESNSLTQLELAGQIDKSPAKISLELDNRESKPFVHLTGSLSTLDLSKLMASAKSEILPLYSDDTKLPFSWIGWLDVEADLTLKQLNLSHINLNNVNTSLQVKGNKLDIQRLQADAYDGSIDAAVSVDDLGESYNILIKTAIKSINLKKVLSSLFDVNAIAGRANLVVDATAQHVVTYQDVHRKLNGEVKLEVVDGGFSGVDFSVFLSPENLAAFQNRNAVMTNFTSLNAGFNFVNGISKHSNLSFSSPTIMASGSGLIDFAETKIDYQLIVSSILPINVQNIKSVSIPVGISGDLFNPKIYIQNMTLNSESGHSGRVRRAHKHR